MSRYRGLGGMWTMPETPRRPSASEARRAPGRAAGGTMTGQRGTQQCTSHRASGQNGPDTARWRARPSKTPPHLGPKSATPRAINTNMPRIVLHVPSPPPQPTPESRWPTSCARMDMQAVGSRICSTPDQPQMLGSMDVGHPQASRTTTNDETSQLMPGTVHYLTCI